MGKSNQISSWAEPPVRGQNRSKTNDEDERRRLRYRRQKPAFSNLNCCCCPCSAPLLGVLLIGALIAGVALAIFLALYLVDSGKTTSLPTNATLATTVTSATSTTVTTTSSSSSTSSTSTTTTTTVTTSTTSATTSTTTSTATTTTVTTLTTTSTTSTTSVTTSTTTSTTTTEPYCTTLITFNDIANASATSGVIPNGYKFLNWTNAYYLNASTVPMSGYQTADYSPPYIAYNPGGVMVQITSANGTSFAWNSLVVAAAWRNNLILTVYGYRYGVNTLSGSVSITEVNQTTVTCGGCTNYDTLQFITSGGTPVSGLAQSGTEFGFDNLCISFGY